MKRIFFIALTLFTANLSSFAQGELDLYRFSSNDLKGTARSIGMGGAFGALGGDISGIAINPAGIGVYKSSEIVTTMNFQNSKNEVKNGRGVSGATNIAGDDSKFTFSFDNLAFVGAFPIDSDIAPYVNFGFSYNRLKSFDRKMNVKGSYLSYSMTDFMAELGDGTSRNNLEISNNNNPFTNGSNWLAALGYNGGLIKPGAEANTYNSVLYGRNDPSLDNDFFLREKGSIDSYDFNVGTTFSDLISVGLTVAITDINYRLYSDYYEELYSGDNLVTDYYLENWKKTEGTGYQFRAGVIVKPIDELRFGVAYHSPTWYQMTDHFSARMDALDHDVIDTWDEAGNTYYDYDIKTPDKWSFSLAGIIGQTAIISADYELTNYKNMKFRNADRDASLTAQNSFVKEDFKNSSTLRVGAEIRFTPQFSGRVGYAWMQSPYADKVKDGEQWPVTAGTAVNYTIAKDTHHFTYGLGYRFTPNFYGDIAFVMKNQKSDFYTFDGSDAGELKNNTFNGLLTLGYRF